MSEEAQRLPTDAKASMLTEEEIDSLIGIAAAYSRHGPLTTEEVECVVQWAHNTRVNNALLELVLSGLVVMTWNRDANDLWFFTPNDQA